MTGPGPVEHSPNATVKALAVLVLVVLVTVSTGSMINVALPVIGREFSVSEGIYSWIATAYTFTFGLFATVHGRLAAIFGARRVYLAAITGFAVVSLALTVAPWIELIIALRALQGIAGAAMPVLGSLLITRIVAPERRGNALGILFATTGVAVTTGPFVGGLLAQLGHWRAIFALPVLLVPVVLAGQRWLPPSLDDDRRSQPFDIPGALLLGAGTGALMWSFLVIENHGVGEMFAAALLAGAVALAAFAWHIRTAAQPYIAPALFRSRPYLVAVGVAFLVQTTRLGSLVLVPIALIESGQLAPVWVGAVLLPGAIITTLGAKRAGRWSDRVGARLPIALGCMCMVAGNLVTAVYVSTSVWGIGAGMALYGLGYTLIQSPLMSVATHIIPGPLMSMGLGVFMMIGFLGGAFGTALSVTVVELQSVDAVSWLGMAPNLGTRYSNALCVLAVLVLAAAVLCRYLPPRGHRAAE